MAQHFSFDKFVTLVKKLFQIQNDLVCESVLIGRHECKYEIIRLEALCVLGSWCRGPAGMECSCVFEELSAARVTGHRCLCCPIADRDGRTSGLYTIFSSRAVTGKRALLDQGFRMPFSQAAPAVWIHSIFFPTLDQKLTAACQKNVVSVFMV